MYSRDNKIYIVNYLNDAVIIQPLGHTLNSGGEYVADFTNNVEIIYQEESYYYEFTESQSIEFKTLFIKENE